MKKHNHSSSHLFSTVLICVVMLAGFLIFSKKTSAQAIIPGVPFAGQIVVTQVCCNGIEFTLTPQYRTVARGLFFFPYANMPPRPHIGYGLYEWYSIITTALTVGRAHPPITNDDRCLTISTNCEVANPADNWTVLEAGTNQPGTAA
jgi:hypothetical protein